MLMLLMLLMLELLLLLLLIVEQEGRGDGVAGGEEGVVSGGFHCAGWALLLIMWS